MKPSLLTSSNSACHAVDGSVSPPANGSPAAAPWLTAMFS
jgi:hypothetical protein